MPDTSRRGDKIGIALLDNIEEGLVSQAYTVFEITDTKTLLPEYLMMWFRRPEFDRYARYISHGSVREIFGWEDMCDVKLPIPSINKQKEIVKEYNVLVDRIKLNNQLIQKLEETAQSIYNQWFVDFEFPDEEGKGYKSNGGEMVFSKELGKEIPKGWRPGTLDELIDVIDGDRGNNYPSIDEMYDNGFCLFLNAGNVTKIGFDFSETKFISKEKDKDLRKGKLKRNDVILTSRGTVGNVAFYSDAIIFNDIRINSGMVIMRAKDFLESTIFIYSMLRNAEIKKAIENYLSGSAQPQLPIKDLIKIPILIPEKVRIIKFSNSTIMRQLYDDRLNNQNLKLNELSDLLLSKLATIEN
ncbi:MAG: restriction endonuclease subunit S [Flavobacterium sp.]|uniref:restriction endonuclease subunit S n=1 Tax=Flavobacterium sp. TaxID=239 RepID=UPI003267606B